MLCVYQTMETMHEGEDLVFLYHLKPGSVTYSYAFHIAMAAGLPKEVIARAKEVSAHPN